MPDDRGPRRPCPPVGRRRRQLAREELIVSDQDLRMTAEDFLLLGQAYRKQKRLALARAALEKARQYFAEIHWECDVDALMVGKSAFIGPADKARSWRRRFW